MCFWKSNSLLDGNLIWFDTAQYGVDQLVYGDEFVINYSGTYEVQEVYPGNVNANKMNIKSIDVVEAEIVEFIVTKGEDDELKLSPLNASYNNFILLNEGYVVSQDGTFKTYNQYAENTIIYASISSTASSNSIGAFYDYKPREVRKPASKYNLSIIDNGFFLIDDLSSDEGKYTPYTKLEFYTYPLINGDLSLYVNDTFYKNQETVEVNGEYLWKYTFTMINENVELEFKVENYVYSNVQSVLNIPDLTNSDVLKVRLEKGWLQVHLKTFPIATI